MAYLELRLAGGQTLKIMLREGDNVLGSAEAAGIRFQDPMIAPQQALIKAKSGAFTVRNLAPENPVFLNNALVEAERPLRPGDQLIIGSTRCFFFDVDLDATREMLEISLHQRRSDSTVGPATPPDPAAPPPANPPPAAVTEQDLQSYHHLVFPGAPGGRPPALLKDKEVILGGTADAGVRLEGSDIAPRHAKIIQREDGIVIVDLESPSGVFLNDRRIFREALKDADVIRIGGVRLVYHKPLEPPPPQPEAKPTAPKLAAAAAAKPVRGSRVLTWLAAGVIGLVVVGVLVVGGIWFLKRLRTAGRETDSRRQVEELVRQRQWQPLTDLLLGDKDFPLPVADKQRLLELAQLEVDASLHDQSLRKALDGGDLESALAYFYKIPAASVYRPEAQAAVSQHIDAAIDGTISKPDLGFNDYTAVVTLSEKLLQLEPKSASALAYICLARLGQGDLPATAAAAERLIAAHPEQGEGYYFKALALYRAGQYPAALASVSEALRRQPANVDMLLLRAKLSILMQRLADARLDLAKVLDADPGNATAKALYARLSGQALPPPAATAAEARQYEELLRRRRAAANGERADTEIRQLYLQGNVAAARQQLQDRIRRSPKDPAAGRWTAELEAMARIEELYRAGDTLRATDLPAAIARWEEMRRLEATVFPGARSRFTADASSAAADYFAGRALADLQRGQLDRAYDLATRALAWQSDHAQAQSVARQIDDTAQQLYQEGFRHYQGGDRSGARQYWEKVLRTVTAASPWYSRAKEKLTELEEVQ
jgi:pSer/pThr/pTyr-binding forkhead associated (FHA) protein/tetratricopeptide (TPR) repeat protein